MFEWIKVKFGGEQADTSVRLSQSEISLFCKTCINFVPGDGLLLTSPNAVGLAPRSDLTGA